MTPLELQIKTVADTRGVTLTDEGLQRIKRRTEELDQAFAKNTKSSSGVTEQMRQQAQEALRNIESTEKQSKAAESLTHNVNSVKTAWSGLRDVLGGVLAGNIIQIGSGLTKISAAAAAASPSIQALFGAIARGAAASSIAVGPALVAIGALNEKARQNQKEIEDTYKRRADLLNQIKTATDANTAAVEAWGKKELEYVTKISAAYVDLRTNIDAASKRVSTIGAAKNDLEDAQIDRDEKRALAKAKTPQERQKIEEKFAARRATAERKRTIAGFDDTDLDASVRIKNAEEALAQSRAERDAVANEIDTRERRVANLTDRAADLAKRFGAGTPVHQKALADARSASDELKKYRTESADKLKPLDESDKAAQSQIDQAKLTIEETALRRQAYQAIIEGKAADLKAKANDNTASSTERAATEKEIRQLKEDTKGLNPVAPSKPSPILGEITTADGRRLTIDRNATRGSGGTITRNGESVHVDSSDTIAQLRKAGQVIGDTFREIKDFSGTVTKIAEDTKRQLRDTRERSGGG